MFCVYRKKNYDSLAGCTQFFFRLTKIKLIRLVSWVKRSICLEFLINKKRVPDIMQTELSRIHKTKGNSITFAKREYSCMMQPFQNISLCKKWISSVKVTQSAVSCGFGHIY